MNKIALFTIALGDDPIYFNSVRRYLPYNKKYFAQNHEVVFFVFTDREEIIEGVVNIPTKPIMWPYIALLKNNIIANYLNETNTWSEYSYIYFIDADFAIGDKYDFFSHEFIFLKPHWNSKVAGGFYGGKTNLFRKLLELFYDELMNVYLNKLSVPNNLDEFYLELFYLQNVDKVHIIEMIRGINTHIFYDNEDIDGVNKLFLHPYKSEQRANKQLITDSFGNISEYTLNISEGYIFNNNTKELGRIFKEKEFVYRLLWSNNPENREVLNTKENKISKQLTLNSTFYSSPILSIVMPVYNVHSTYLKDCIDSVLNQSFRDFEFLIINDGSTSIESIDLLKQYNDSRIRLIHNNHDFIKSLNIGILESRGKYIVRMDGDDIMLPHRLKIQYEFMEKNLEIDVCGSSMKIIGNSSGYLETKNNNEEIIASMLLANPMSHPTIIMRKSSVCKDNKPLYKYGYACAEDYKLWTDLAMKNFRFANIPEYLLCHRQSGDQITRTHMPEMINSTRKVRIEFTQYVMEKLYSEYPQMDVLLNNIIDLYDSEMIRLNGLTNIVYQLYIEYQSKFKL